MASNQSELEHAYNLLTNKLRKLNYNYPIGIESTQLVDKILTQLISTTEGYQKLSNKFNVQKSELEAEKKICLPLRNENMKLVHENNDLHLEMIKIREDFERKEINITNSISKLDKEKQEMRYLLLQKDSHIKNIEIESENLRKKLNEITEKVYGKNKKGIVNSNMPNSKIFQDMNSSMNILGKKQEIILSSGIDSDFQYPNEIRKLFKHIQVNKEEWANDIKASDERTIKFREDIKKLEETNKILVSKFDHMNKQISNREQEIKRLSSSYSTSENLDEIKMKYDAQTLRNQIDKLNLQIDFLNKENHKREEIVQYHNTKCNLEELKKLEKNINIVKKENEKLKKELSENNINTNETNGNSNRMSANKDKGEEVKNSSLIEENLKLKKEISILQNKNKELRENAENLVKENEKVCQMNSENSSYVNSDRAAMIKNINLMKEEIRELKNQINEAENKRDQINKQNENLISELNLIKGKEMLKNTDFENTSENMNKFYKEYSEVANENKNLRKKLNELEALNLNLSKIHATFTKENENIQKINSNLENKILLLEEELSKFKFITDNSATSSQKLETQFTILDNKYKNILSENQNLNNILENKTNLLKDSEQKNENYFNQIQNCNETIANLQAEFKGLSKELTDLNSKNKRLEDKIKSYEKDFNENKFIKEKIIDFEELARSLKAEKYSLDKENKSMKSEILKLNQELSNLKNLEIENKSLIEILREEKKKILKQLESNSKDLINMEDKIGNSDLLANHLEDIKSKNSEYMTQISNKNLDIENLNNQINISKFEIKKRDNEILRLKDTVEGYKIESNAKIEEMKFLKEQIDKLRNDLLEKKIYDNCNISANLLELQEKYTQEKISSDKANFTIKDLNEKLYKLSQEKENFSNKITNMTKLLAEADNTRAEMFSKIQQEINKSKYLENDNMILKEKEQKNLNEILNLQDENKQLKSGISSLDQNYDILNNELDMKTEEISKLNLIIKNLNDANDEVSKKLSVQLSKCSTDSKRLSERELEVKEMRITNSKLQKDNMELNAILQQKNLEFQEYNYEIKRLSEENSGLSEQLIRLSQENEKMSLIKTQLEKNSEFIANKYRSNELDMSELFNSYKDACKENERLKRNLQVFIDENQQAFNHIKNIENNLSNAMTNIQSNMMEKETLVKKIEMMEMFSNEQNMEIERLREKIESKISNEEKLKRNLELDQEININYENHSLKLQKQISKLENDKKEYEEIIKNLKNQIEYLNHLNKKQEYDMNNLEIILVDERKKLHNYDCQLNKHRDEIEKLKAENTQLIELINQNSEMKNLKSKINDLNFAKMNEDDNNAYKFLVHDLQNQLISLQNDLRTVREENTRLLSERSMRDNHTSDRLFSASSPSSKSDSRAVN